MSFPGQRGNVEVNTTMDLIPHDPTIPPVIPAPPVRDPIAEALASRAAGETPSPGVQRSTLADPADWLIIATAEEWEWAEEILQAWFDPAITDKMGLAEQMNQLLGVMVNEVMAQRDRRSNVSVTRGAEVVSEVRSSVDLSRIETDINSLQAMVHDIRSATIDLAANSDSSGVDRNALHVAVMGALIDASPEGANNSKKLLEMTRTIVSQVCGDA